MAGLVSSGSTTLKSFAWCARCLFDYNSIKSLGIPRRVRLSRKRIDYTSASQTLYIQDRRLRLLRI